MTINTTTHDNSKSRIKAIRITGDLTRYSICDIFYFIIRRNYSKVGRDPNVYHRYSRNFPGQSLYETYFPSPAPLDRRLPSAYDEETKQIQSHVALRHRIYFVKSCSVLFFLLRAARYPIHMNRVLIHLTGNRAIRLTKEIGKMNTFLSNYSPKKRLVTDFCIAYAISELLSPLYCNEKIDLKARALLCKVEGKALEVDLNGMDVIKFYKAIPKSVWSTIIAEREEYDYWDYADPLWYIKIYARNCYYRFRYEQDTSSRFSKNKSIEDAFESTTNTHGFPCLNFRDWSQLEDTYRPEFEQGKHSIGEVELSNGTRFSADENRFCLYLSDPMDIKYWFPVKGLWHPLAGPLFGKTEIEYIFEDE